MWRGQTPNGFPFRSPNNLNQQPLDRPDLPQNRTSHPCLPIQQQQQQSVNLQMFQSAFQAPRPSNNPNSHPQQPFANGMATQQHNLKTQNIKPDSQVNTAASTPNPLPGNPALPPLPSNGVEPHSNIALQQQLVLNQMASVVTSIQNPLILLQISAFFQIVQLTAQNLSQISNPSQGQNAQSVPSNQGQNAQSLPSNQAQSAQSVPSNQANSHSTPYMNNTSHNFSTQNNQSLLPPHGNPAFPLNPSLSAQNPSVPKESSLTSDHYQNPLQIPNQMHPPSSPAVPNLMFPANFPLPSQNLNHPNGVPDVLAKDMALQGNGFLPPFQNQGQLQQFQHSNQHGELQLSQGRLSEKTTAHASTPATSSSGGQAAASDRKTANIPPKTKKRGYFEAEEGETPNGKRRIGDFPQRSPANGNTNNRASPFSKQNGGVKDARNPLGSPQHKHFGQSLSATSHAEDQLKSPMRNVKGNSSFKSSGPNQTGTSEAVALSEEDRLWREERRKFYPTDSNLQRKAAELQQRLARGEFADHENAKRKQRVREILATQVQLGCAVTEIQEYLNEKGRENAPKETVSKTPDVCEFFLKRGRCKYGKRCRLLHDNSLRQNYALQGKGKSPAMSQTPVKKSSLLEKLLSKDTGKEKTHLLQVFRFMVNNSFLAEWPNKPLHLFEWCKEQSETNEEDTEKHFQPSLQSIPSGSNDTDPDAVQTSSDSDSDSDSEDAPKEISIRRISSAANSPEDIFTAEAAVDKCSGFTKSTTGELSSNSGEDVEEGEILDQGTE
eukprot:TRINITY_DN616_c0_g1_i1.p1 TRINITY_DN616_c0_g1~~TRINITY_DN616_c0_g1_i1.p1  ORF type:complete len:778 (-),score=173.09 TRINITY_DN616_c0_g1_i1:36-2369(-)